MINLKDNRTEIVPSHTRGGKELPSSSAFDSLTVLNCLVTPPPIARLDMLHEFYDATYEINDDIIATHDETETIPLGELLDAHIARASELENAEIDEDFELLATPRAPNRYVLPYVPEGYVMDGEVDRDFLACNDRDDFKKILGKLKE